MANSVKPWLKEDVRQRILSGESIKSVVKTLGISRNAIRRLIKSEGLMAQGSTFWGPLEKRALSSFFHPAH